MDRAEHLTWCKSRALAYVDLGELDAALASFVSDLRKHDDTLKTLHAVGPLLTMDGAAIVLEDNAPAMRNLIEGIS
jgi:hypothetical protein